MMATTSWPLLRKSALLLIASVLWLNSAVRTENYTTLIDKYAGADRHMSVDEFQTLLDSVHNPAANTSACIANDTTDCTMPTQECFTAHEILSKVNMFNKPVDERSLELACPIILSQVDSHVCSNAQSPKQKPEKERPKASHVWGFGLLFVTIISLCSLVGVSVMPLMEKAFYKQLLTLLIGLAVGSLSGSAIFHLIPQAFGLLTSGQHHHYLNISLMIWSGIWVFFMTERILKLISDYRDGRKTRNQPKDLGAEMASPTGLLPEEEMENCIQPRPNAIYDCQEQAIKASFGHQEKARVSHTNDRMHYEPGKDSAIATVAWMVVFGDGLHNFIDGLSIGAAFNESVLTGISISLAVLCEELPHELGDFAVLLNAGMTMRQAVIYNFLSACTCYLGLIMGIVLGEIEASTHIFAFAGGMFLYISLVDMVPEMNEVAEEASKQGMRQAFQVLFLQNVGIGIGMFALYILARYQDTFAFV